MQPGSPDAVGLALDRPALTAHLLAGAIWVTGFSVAAQGLGLVLTAAASACVVLGSLARASRRLRTGRTVVTCWTLVVLLLTVLLAPAAGWFSVVLAVVLGSVLFGTWAVTGAFLTQVLGGAGAADPAYPDTP